MFPRSRHNEHRGRGGGMRRVVILAAIAGAIAFTVLVARVGLGAVVGAMQTLGWTGFAAIVVVHLGVIMLAGFAWSQLARSRTDGHVRWFVWGRLIRDSAAETLPFSQVGGLVMGARAAALCGTPGKFAAASTVVDVTLEFAARVPYMFLGLGLLAWRGLANQAGATMLATTLLIAAGAAVCVVLQVRGADLFGAFGARIVPQWVAERSAGAAGVLDTIRALHARRGALCRAFAVHCLAWTVGGIEATLPLWLMGKPVWIGTGIAIDCLVAAMRSVGFMVPGSIGIQEGAYVLVCGLFGIDPHVALALSLLRRGRDFAIGIPSLMAWQMLEGQSALRDLAGDGSVSLLLPSPAAPRNPANPDASG